MDNEIIYFGGYVTVYRNEEAYEIKRVIYANGEYCKIDGYSMLFGRITGRPKYFINRMGRYDYSIKPYDCSVDDVKIKASEMRYKIKRVFPKVDTDEMNLSELTDVYNIIYQYERFKRLG
jgi:hypothetical protein